MSRYRQPSPWGSPYITAEGERALQAELHQLWKIERPQVTDAVHEAAKNGDRSENGDYIYGKRRLREIDRRVTYLKKRLEQLTVVDQIPSNPNKVYFGAWVTLAWATPTSEEEQEITYRIVGPDEFDLSKNYLSMDAPLAKQMLGKQKDDEFIFVIGEQKTAYTITHIEYKK